MVNELVKRWPIQIIESAKPIQVGNELVERWRMKGKAYAISSELASVSSLSGYTFVERFP